MTDLEKQTFQDGFLVLLLGVDADGRTDRLAFQARLFDGGRLTVECERYGSYAAPSPRHLDELRHLVIRVLAPPHVLVAYGRGWHALLEASVPAYLEQLRILDLRRAAAALDLDARLSPNTDIAELATAYGIDGAAIGETPFPSAFEDLLWAVVARAGAKGMTWAQLLAHEETARPRVDFDRYEFSEFTLSLLPPAPGVYFMRDEHGHVLYVGKAANLARRLGDYFRNTWRPDAKLAALRERIRRFEYRRVGSELEALLLENRLIHELRPEANVQVQTHAHAGRYPEDYGAVVVLCPSELAGRCELFFFGTRETAMQLRLNPARPPQRLLQHLVGFIRGGGRTPGRSVHLTDWGRPGAEICHRYFARFRNRLQWVEIAGAKDGATEAVKSLLEVARTVARSAPETGEFRLDSAV